MKKIIAIALMALVAVSATAQTIPECWKVDWTFFAVYDPADDSVGIMDNYSIVWDLCWSASADKSDEVILGTREFASGAASYADTANDFYGTATPVWDNYLSGLDGNTAATITIAGTGTSSPGYIWQRIIAYSDAPSGTNYIFDGDAVAVKTTTSSMEFPTDLGSVIEVGLPGSEWSIYSPTPVPEPATMSLLGLGALAMVLRRKLRK